MRGEYLITAILVKQQQGSPPHAWRIPVLQLNRYTNIGITSTCVENTLTLEIFRREDEDHLHMRGEYLALAIASFEVKGSPPHAWRILYELRPYQTDLRITSTCVENTSWLPCRQIQERDHLHMRGEYWFIQSISIVFQGSPPHAWRIPAVGTKNTAQLGITSTCVENTYDLIARF